MTELKFEKKIIQLKKELKQEFYIDPSQKHIAETRSDKKIYVNPKFLKLPLSEQKIIIYHERGHSKFKLFNFVGTLTSYSLLLCIFLFFCSLVLLLFLNKQLDSLFFGVALFSFTIFFFTIYITLNWLIEILADLNAIKNIEKRIFLKVLNKIYQKNDFSWLNGILHPPLKLREKIIKELD